MRQIKFRAWDKKNKRMIPNHSITYLNEMFESDLDDLFVMDKELEVMQYTGLKDKNDKEIYEGDIIESEKNALVDDGKTRNKVIFEDGAFKVASVNLAIVSESFYPEVIGNIYENKELIK